MEAKTLSDLRSGSGVAQWTGPTADALIGREAGNCLLRPVINTSHLGGAAAVVHARSLSQLAGVVMEPSHRCTAAFFPAIAVVSRCLLWTVRPRPLPVCSVAPWFRQSEDEKLQLSL